MRFVARLAVVAATTLALVLPLPGAAFAKPDGPTLPSAEQITQAQREVQARQRSVASIQAALAGAQSRLMEAGLRAEQAAEAYNGARWRLTMAHEARVNAERAQREARVAVERQRSGIITLVTESYQNGTELSTATALVGEDGPEGLMNRYAVVQSAGDSMEAAYDRFRVASAKAKESSERAGRAEKRQQGLAEEAHRLASEASDATLAATVAASDIADQKQALVAELAKAENTTLELAKKRQQGLVREAAQMAREADRAKEVAERRELRKAAREARKQARQADRAKPDLDNSRPGDEEDSIGIALPVPAPPVVVNPAPNHKTAVQRVVDYAKAQVGKPYQWAASGPFTFDCSGLTMRAWAAGGKLLPHYSVAQFAQSTRISIADARAGDLLFWSNNGSPSGIHHVALHIGKGTFIEAPFTGGRVRYMKVADKFPDFVARP